MYQLVRPFLLKYLCHYIIILFPNKALELSRKINLDFSYLYIFFNSSGNVILAMIKFAKTQLYCVTPRLCNTRLCDPQTV